MALATPLSAVAKLRPQVSSGLLLGAAAVSAIFVATSFVIPEVIDRYDIGLGTAATISTAQVGGFMLTNLFAGRRLVPTASMARQALLAMVAFNALSTIAPNFPVLVALRFGSGVAMGLFTWIAWADTASSQPRRGEIAAIGPLTSALVAPVLGVVLVWGGGLASIYGTLAIICLACLALPIKVEAEISGGRRPLDGRGIIPVLLGMGALTLGGSAVFIFVGVIAADKIGMSSMVLALALSLNALAGIPAARYAGRRRFPGLFIAICGLSAMALVFVENPVVFVVVLVVWGGAFWIAIPETYELLARRSKHPADRIGDAQAIMAAGRVIGPSVGGLLVAGGSFAVLGLVAGSVMVLGGLMVEYVALSKPPNVAGA